MPAIDEFARVVWRLFEMHQVSSPTPFALVDDLSVAALALASSDDELLARMRSEVVVRETTTATDIEAAVLRWRRARPVARPANRGAASLRGHGVTVVRATNPQAVDIPDTPSREVTI